MAWVCRSSTYQSEPHKRRAENVPSAWKSLAALHKRKGGFMALELYIDSKSTQKALLVGSQKRSIADPAALESLRFPEERETTVGDVEAEAGHGYGCGAGVKVGDGVGKLLVIGVGKD
ncbi:hypothetical protein R3P38DRAFT_2775774 [Favolaschia claudopus]|uniref:Uncharacterized protein n=1 Tax=Favolaschia claudopus TaxID=2862362 RepID=A0AAW0BSQ7_9AGAR